MARVTLNDDTYDALRQEKRTPDQVSALVEKLLAPHFPYEQGARTLLLKQDTLEALDAILGRGNVLDAKDLVAKVQALADLEVGKVRIPLTQPQLQALRERAVRTDRSVGDLLKAMVHRFLESYEGIAV